MNLAQFWPKPTWARACIALAAAILIAIPSLAAVKTAIQNALNLDSQMNVFYARTLDEYLTQFRKQHPIILGLFSNEGGDFYLYMHGQVDPIRANSVPVQYQVVKGVSHSSMALYAILQPYIDGLSTDSNWKADFTAYRQQQVKTLADADQMGLAPEVDAAGRGSYAYESAQGQWGAAAVTRVPV